MKKPTGTFRCKTGHLLDGSKVLQFNDEQFCSKTGSRRGKCGKPVKRISSLSLKDYRKL